MFDVIVPVGPYHVDQVGLTIERMLRVGGCASHIETISIVGEGLDRPLASACNSIPIQVVRTDGSVRPSIARNMGVRACAGRAEWLLFLDVDVSLAADFILRLAARARGLSKDTVAVCPAFGELETVDSVLQILEHREDQRVLESYSSGALHTRVLRGAAICIRRSTFDELGGFDEHLVAAEDRDLAARVIEAGGSIAFDRRLVVMHSPPSSIANLMRRKRWHAIGNAQFACKVGGGGYLSARTKIARQVWRPLRSADGVYGFIYHWIVGGFYLACYYRHLRRLRRTVTWDMPPPSFSRPLIAIAAYSRLGRVLSGG